MATGPNGIATRRECNIKDPNSFTSELDKCPTKAEILTTNKLTIKNSGNYATNQLVIFEHIDKAMSISVSPTSYTALAGGSSFTLTVTSTSAWTLTKPSWVTTNISSGSAGTTNVIVTVAYNTGGQRGESITAAITTSGGPSASCYISQPVPVANFTLELSANFEQTSVGVSQSGSFVFSGTVGKSPTSITINANLPFIVSAGSTGFDHFGTSAEFSPSGYVSGPSHEFWCNSGETWGVIQIVRTY